MHVTEKRTFSYYSWMFQFSSVKRKKMRGNDALACPPPWIRPLLWIIFIDFYTLWIWRISFVATPLLLISLATPNKPSSKLPSYTMSSLIILVLFNSSPPYLFSHSQQTRLQNSIQQCRHWSYWYSSTPLLLISSANTAQNDKELVKFGF